MHVKVHAEEGKNTAEMPGIHTQYIQNISSQSTDAQLLLL